MSNSGNVRVDDGKTSAFDRAIVYNDSLLSRVLIEAGIDLLQLCAACARENYLHRIALHNADLVFAGLPDEAIQQLINQPDSNGSTPVFWALENGHAELAIAYVKAGASITHVNRAGEDVMTVAYKQVKENRSFIAFVGNLTYH